MLALLGVLPKPSDGPQDPTALDPATFWTFVFRSFLSHFVADPETW